MQLAHGGKVRSRISYSKYPVTVQNGVKHLLLTPAEGKKKLENAFRHRPKGVLIAKRLVTVQPAEQLQYSSDRKPENQIETQYLKR